MKPGEIIYAEDDFAVMLLPNGLLVGDKLYEEDFIGGINAAYEVLKDTTTQIEITKKQARGFAWVMFEHFDQLTHKLWGWLQGKRESLFAVHPFIEEMMVALASRDPRPSILFLFKDHPDINIEYPSGRATLMFKGKKVECYKTNFSPTPIRK